MSDHLSSSDRSWVCRFHDAFRGVKAGVRGQSSFFVHFFAAAVVLAAGAVLRVEFCDWCLLLLCIAGVMTAEMFNSALESMAKAISSQSDPHLGSALDIAAAAVLTASIAAALVGTIIFARRVGIMLGWW
jgi:diacylglycerol kinase